MQTHLKVVAADDHKLFLEGLKSLFAYTAKYNLVAVCEDGNALLNSIHEHQPDIALIDLSMPGESTESIISTIDDKYPETQLIALTMHAEPARAEQLIQLGLCGYVLKEAAFEELHQAIDCVAKGNQFLSPALVATIQEQHNKTIDDPILTPRETRVLQLVADGFSNKEIARQLDISERTVRFHLSNCCIKLDAQTRANAVAKALHEKLINHPAH